MAFTGAAVVQQISDQKVRITGLSLAGAAVGIIGLFGDVGADVQLPDGFNPKNYQAFGALVDLADSLEVSYWRAAAAGGGAGTIYVTKGGAPFRITMTNADAQNATSEVEIFVAFHE